MFNNIKHYSYVLLNVPLSTLSVLSTRCSLLLFSILPLKWCFLNYQHQHLLETIYNVTVQQIIREKKINWKKLNTASKGGALDCIKGPHVRGQTKKLIDDSGRDYLYTQEEGTTYLKNTNCK